jgi:hypothetical protein
MSVALILLRHRLKKANVTSMVSQLAIAMCEIIDHFNDLHWHDRGRLGEMIAKQEMEIAALKKRLFDVEHKDDAA